MEKNDYTLIDSGKGNKLEKFGPFLIRRPAAQALWIPTLSEKEWDKAQAVFTREEDKKWSQLRTLPPKWHINVAGITFKIEPTDFGHLGIFPEQKPQWEWITRTILHHHKKTSSKMKVLNLFAYSGGSTMAAGKAGAEVVHLDASKGMITWARENAALNGLTDAPIRWIIDDVKKFLKKELRRGSKYDAIILDPPSFGRGSKGEIFKIEEDILSLLDMCRQLLSDRPVFVLFSCHSPGFTEIAMKNLMGQMMKGVDGVIESGEMCLFGEKNVLPLPSGTFARWYCGD